jgi:hypothetical protein
MIKGIMEIDFSETVSGYLLATLIRRRELAVSLNLDSNINQFTGTLSRSKFLVSSG